MISEHSLSFLELQVVPAPGQQPNDRGVHAVGQHVGGQKALLHFPGFGDASKSPAATAGQSGQSRQDA